MVKAETTASEKTTVIPAKPDFNKRKSDETTRYACVVSICILGLG
jgi:hypothetical protein